VNRFYSFLILLLVLVQTPIAFGVRQEISNDKNYASDKDFEAFLKNINKDFESFKTPLHYVQYKAFIEVKEREEKLKKLCASAEKKNAEACKMQSHFEAQRKRDYREWVTELQKHGCSPLVPEFADCRKVESQKQEEERFESRGVAGGSGELHEDKLKEDISGKNKK
jgi:hypothetical protein